MIKKEELEEVRQIKGNVRGTIFQARAIFIRERIRKDGFKRSTINN